MKKKTKIMLAIAIGFAIAMLIMTIAIYFGYINAYRMDVETFFVRLIFIPIYKLTKIGAEYMGEPQGVFMGIFCGICMALSVAIEEVSGRIRKK